MLWEPKHSAKEEEVNIELSLSYQLNDNNLREIYDDEKIKLREILFQLSTKTKL